jgi:predicted DNA-binding transcriptional regulator YafY
MTNQTIRVLELLKRFNSGQKVCIDILKFDVLWENKSEKTIRRDLDVIKLVFPESFELIRGQKGCYKAITKKAFDQFLDERNLALLIQTFSIAHRSDLFDSLDIEDNDKRIIEKKLKDTKKIYEFKTKPFESKKDDYIIFKKLEHVIRYQKYITINYVANKVSMSYTLKPYKIIFMNENFYLAGEVDNQEFVFALYRISKIESILESNKTFQKNLEINEFIKFMQTPFAQYKKEFKRHLIKIVLEVDSSKAFFFKSKKFLASQEIIEEMSNGNLIVSYYVTQELEIEELIKKWLPHIYILEPLSLKEKIMKELEFYLKNT